MGEYCWFLVPIRNYFKILHLRPSISPELRANNVHKTTSQLWVWVLQTWLDPSREDCLQPSHLGSYARVSTVSGSTRGSVQLERHAASIHPEWLFESWPSSDPIGDSAQCFCFSDFVHKEETWGCSSLWQKIILLFKQTQHLSLLHQDEG